MISLKFVRVICKYSHIWIFQGNVLVICQWFVSVQCFWANRPRQLISACVFVCVCVSVCCTLTPWPHCCHLWWCVLALDVLAHLAASECRESSVTDGNEPNQSLGVVGGRLQGESLLRSHETPCGRSSDRERLKAVWWPALTAEDNRKYFFNNRKTSRWFMT